MNACIFIMSVNAMMAIYGHKGDIDTVDSVGVGDQLCVVRIEGNWTQVHWSSGNIGHTGWVRDVNTKQNAQPTEPTAREEEYAPQAPVPMPPPPPDMPPQQQRGYINPQAPNPDYIVRPMALAMECKPIKSQWPYKVLFMNHQAAVVGGKTGHGTQYPVIDEHDDQSNHVMYVAMKRPDQVRTVYLAFDYSQRGEDVSALVTKNPVDGEKARDKCAMDWQNTK